MNERELQRNVARIPRLTFLIRKAQKAGQDERVESFKKELDRRKYQLMAAGYEGLVKTLLALKLEPQANKDSAKLKDILREL